MGLYINRPRVGPDPLQIEGRDSKCAGKTSECKFTSNVTRDEFSKGGTKILYTFGNKTQIIYETTTILKLVRSTYVATIFYNYCKAIDEVGILLNNIPHNYRRIVASPTPRLRCPCGHVVPIPTLI
jgi:hypothetical protein